MLVSVPAWWIATAPAVQVTAAFMLAGAIAVAAIPIVAATIAALAVPLATSTGVSLGVGLVSPGSAAVALGTIGVGYRLLNSSALRAALRVRSPRPFRVVLALAACYAAALGLSAAAAPDWAAASVETVRWILFGLATLVAFAAAQGRRAARALAVGLLAAGGLAAIHGLAGAAQGIGPPAYALLGGKIYRAFGLFGQPNPFGGYMNLTWPLGVALSLAGAAAWLRRAHRSADDRGRGPSGARTEAINGAGEVPWWLALAGAAAAAAAVAGLAASWSRGAWLGFGAAAVAMILVLAVRVARPPWPAWMLAGTLGAAAVVLFLAASGTAGLAPDTMRARLGSIATTFTALDVADAEVTDANFATVERVAHWQAAARMWRDRPWLGQGPGHYEIAYAAYRLPRWADALGHAHNYYLNALAETGIVGFAAYVALAAAALAFAVRLALRADMTSFAWAIALGLTGTLAALSVHSLVDNLYVHDMTVTLGLLIGLAGAAGTARASGSAGPA